MSHAITHTAPRRSSVRLSKLGVAIHHLRSSLKAVLDAVVNDANTTIITRRDTADAVDAAAITIISCRYHY